MSFLAQTTTTTTGVSFPTVVYTAMVWSGALFALIALMPDFDGWDAGDWGQQEGDDDERRRRGRREGA